MFISSQLKKKRSSDSQYPAKKKKNNPLYCFIFEEWSIYLIILLVMPMFQIQLLTVFSQMCQFLCIRHGSDSWDSILSYLKPQSEVFVTHICNSLLCLCTNWPISTNIYKYIFIWKSSILFCFYNSLILFSLCFDLLQDSLINQDLLLWVSLNFHCTSLIYC